jgi:hypothetical protein
VYPITVIHYIYVVASILLQKSFLKQDMAKQDVLVIMFDKFQPGVRINFPLLQRNLFGISFTVKKLKFCN